MSQLKIQYTPFRFADQQAPQGFLTNDLRSHACWYFFILAEKMRQRAGTKLEDQIILDDSPWLEKDYRGIAKSVALMYGLDSPDDFLHQHWKSLVEQECLRLGYQKPHPEYWVDANRHLIV